MDFGEATQPCAQQLPVRFPLNEDTIERLTNCAIDWAINHGLLPNSSMDSDVYVYRLGFSLSPSPFPRVLFRKAIHLQPIINELLWKAGQDHDFLVSALKSTIQTDEFTARLYKIYEQIRAEGHEKHVTLALLRTDYMVAVDAESGLIDLKQIEINTIAACMTGPSSKATLLHRYILKELKVPDSTLANLPDNHCASNLANGLVAAWEAYGEQSSVILFVIHDEEYNFLDMNSLVDAIADKRPEVKVMFKTITYLGQKTVLTDDARLLIDELEIAVVYYRTGYRPEQFPSESEWRFKLIAEQSTAAVCPSIIWHLMGTKKVQQELSRPGVLETYMDNPEVIASVRSTFTGMYSLDLTAEGDEASAMAIKEPHKYVMKSNGESGGNVLFNDEVRTKLQDLSGKSERSSFILMDTITPAIVEQNYMIHQGRATESTPLRYEYGMFGAFVCKNNNILVNKAAGHLMKSMDPMCNDPRTTTGRAVVDSPYLY